MNRRPIDLVCLALGVALVTVAEVAFLHIAAVERRERARRTPRYRVHRATAERPAEAAAVPQEARSDVGPGVEAGGGRSGAQDAAEDVRAALRAANPLWRGEACWLVDGADVVGVSPMGDRMKQGEA